MRYSSVVFLEANDLQGCKGFVYSEFGNKIYVYKNDTADVLVCKDALEKLGVKVYLTSKVV